MKKALLILLTLLVLVSTFVACDHKVKEPPENAVLTDSDIPLDVGAEIDLSVVDGHANQTEAQ